MIKPMTRMNFAQQLRHDGMYVAHSDALRFTAESVAEAVEAERERCIKIAAGHLRYESDLRAALSPTQGTTTEGGKE